MPWWDDTLLSTCTKASQGSTSLDGDPDTYTVKTTFAARVQRSKARDAETIEHDAVIFTSTPILTTDRIWLPGDDTSSVDEARRPVDVSETHDLDDPDAVLYRVLLGG